MPSNHSSISSSRHSANNGAFSVHSDIAATAAPPTLRFSTRQSLPAGMESLSGRQSLVESRAGSGIRDRPRSESLQNGMAAQAASSSVPSGAWRESLRAGSGGSGSTPAGLDRPGSETHSIVDFGIGVGDMSHAESLQYGMAAQSANPSVTSGVWRESLRAGSNGAGSSGGASLPAESKGSSFGSGRELGVPWGRESFMKDRRSGYFMDDRGKEYSKSELNARGYWMAPNGNLVNRSQVERYKGWGIKDQEQYDEEIRTKGTLTLYVGGKAPGDRGIDSASDGD